MGGTLITEPETSSGPSARARGPIASMALVLVVAACALVLILGLQAVRGEKRNHFGTSADKAPHYLTSLMIHDYAAGGFHGSPVKFGLDYYIHRPKVAFGAWPPFGLLLGLDLVERELESAGGCQPGLQQRELNKCRSQIVRETSCYRHVLTVISP
jgi:hypothetical protein